MSADDSLRNKRFKFMRKAKRHADGSRKKSSLSPLIVEAIEPRLLLSSTTLSNVQAQNAAQSLHDNLAHFEAVLSALATFDKFNHTLPLISGSQGAATIGTAANLAHMLEADVVAPLQGYIQSLSSGQQTATSSAALASGMQSVINSVLGASGSVTVTDKSSGGNIDFAFSFGTQFNEAFTLAMGQNVNINGIHFPADLQGNLQVSLSQFNFETVLASGAKALTDSTVQAAQSADLIDNFSLSNAGVHIDLLANATVASGTAFQVGLLTLNTTAPGTLGYDGALHVSFGSLTGQTLNADANLVNGGSYSFLNGLATVAGDANPSISFALPVSLSATDMSIPGLSSGFTGQIAATGTVLDGNWAVQVTHNSGLSLTVLNAFSTFTPDKFVAAFQSLDSYINSLAGSSLTDVTIPFTKGTTFGDVLNFAENFQHDVVNKLMAVNTLLGFQQNQSATASNGTSAADLVITPVDFSGLLPAQFHLILTVDGHTASIAMTNQYTDGSGTHKIQTVDDLATAINLAILNAPAGSALATVAALPLTVSAINKNTETVAVSGGAVTIGGTVTSGDHVTLKVTNSTALTGGPVVVSYQATATDTLASVATKLAAAINANSTLAAAHITATAANGVVTVTSASGSTTIAAANTSLDFHTNQTGSDATPASIAISTTTSSFDSLSSFAVTLGQALGISDNLNDIGSFLTGLGLRYDPVLNAIELNLNYETSFTLGGAPSESVADNLTAKTVTIGGSATAGDQVAVTISNALLPNGSVTVSYTVKSSDGVNDIANGLASAINGNALLKAQHISATNANGTAVLAIASTAAGTTFSSAASGSIAFGTGLDLGSVASLSGSGNLAISADVGLSMSLGFSLNALDALANTGAQVTVNGKPLGSSTPLFSLPVWPAASSSAAIPTVTADQAAGVVGLPDMQITLRDGTVATIEVQHGQIIDTVGGGAPVAIAGTGIDNTAINIKGNVTIGDTVTLTVSYGANGASTQTISYTAQAGDTTATIATALANAINNNAALKAAKVTAASSANFLDLQGSSATVTGSVTGAGSELLDNKVVTMGDLMNVLNGIKSGNIDVTVGGQAAVGDVLSLTFDNSKLSSPISLSYTVKNGDTLASIASGLMAAINANTSLAAAGISATTQGAMLVVQGGASVTTNPGSLTVGADASGDVSVDGKVVAGDVLSLKVTPSGGSAQVVSYTAQAGDSTADVIAKLVDAIDSLSGVSANIEGVITGANTIVKPNTGDNAADLTYSNGDITVINANAGDHLSLIVNGQTVSYIVQAGHTSAADVVAGLIDAINNAGIKGVSSSLSAQITGATLSIAPSVSETLSVSPASGGVSAIYNASTMSLQFMDGTQVIGQTPVSLGFASSASASAASLANAPQGALSSTNYYQAVLSATPATAVDYSAANQFLVKLGNLPPIEVSIAADASRTSANDFAAAMNAALAQLSVDPALLGLSPGLVIHLANGQSTGHAGDVVSVEVLNKDLAGGSLSISYTVKSGDTAQSIAAGLAAAINANDTLASNAITAKASNGTLTVSTSSGTSTLAGSVSANGGAETVTPLTVAYSSLLQASGQSMTVQGAPKANDVVSAQITNPNVNGGSAIAVSYTVKSGDSASSIANGLMAAINANTTLKAADITATVDGNTVVLHSAAPGVTAVANTSANGNTETLVSSLTLSTTLYNVVSTSAGSTLQSQAAQFGLSITPVDTTVWSLNNSKLVSTLGFSGQDVNGLGSAFGLINSNPLYSTTFADRLFLNNTQLSASFTVAMSNLVLQGSLGFIGFQATGSGYVSLEADLALQSPAGNSYVTFHQLQDALSNGNLSSLWSFGVESGKAGQAWADLSIGSIQLTGSNSAGQLISDLANALVQPSIDIAFNGEINGLSDIIHAKPTVTTTGFDNLQGLQHLSFAQIVQGLQTVLKIIDDDTGSSVLDTKIPLIGESINDLLNYAQSFSSFLTSLQSNPAGTVSQINTVLKSALGPLGSNINLTYSNGSLMLGFTMSQNVNTTLPFSLDLASLASAVGVSLPSEITSLVGVDAAGSLNVTAGAVLGVSMGIQLQAPNATANTSLSALNGGKGLSTNGTSAADLVFQTGSGRQFGVDLDALATSDSLAVSGATVTVGGTVRAGETLSVTIDNAKLDGAGGAGSGAVTISYTVGATDTLASMANGLAQAINANTVLAKAGVTASASGAALSVVGSSSVTANVGGNIQDLVDAINAAAVKSGLSGSFAAFSGGKITLTDSGSVSLPTVHSSSDLGFAQSIGVTGANALSGSAGGAATETVTVTGLTGFTVGGSATTGDSVTVSVNGQTATYTVQAGDSVSDVGRHLADAINQLHLNGVSAQSMGQTSVQVANDSLSIGGKPTAGDTVSVTVGYGSGQSETVTYKVASGDTAASIASALGAKIAADSALQGAGVQAVVTGNAITVVSASGSATLSGAAAPVNAGGVAGETVTSSTGELVSTSLPSSFTGASGSAASNAYTFNVVVNGVNETITVGSNAGRITNADLVAAINQALAAKSVDGGLTSQANAGTSSNLSQFVEAALVGNKIVFVASDAVLGDTHSLAVSDLAPTAKGIAALGFSGSTTATDSAGVSSLTTTLPSTIDYTAAYQFQLTVNGKAATISLASDVNRTSADSFASALNQVLSKTFMSQSDLGIGSAGKILLSQLIKVSDSVTNGTATLTFTAQDARLGSSHSLAIGDVANTTPLTMRVSDQSGSGAAAELGFDSGNQSASAASGTNRVLNSSVITDNSVQHTFFLDTQNTGLTISLGASVSNLNFSTNLGPLSISIQNGFAALGAQNLVNGALPAAGTAGFSVSTDVINHPATLHFGIKDGVTLNEQGDSTAMANRLFFSEVGNISGQQTLNVGGSATQGDVVSVVINSGKLSGAQTVTYTVGANETAATIAAHLAAAINANTTLHNAGVSANAAANATNLAVYGASQITDSVAGTGGKAATEKLSVVSGYSNLLGVTSNVAVQVSLPIYFLGQPLQPVVSIQIGNVLGGSNGWAMDPNPWSISIPNLSQLASSLASSFNVVNFLNNPEAVINGLNSLLGTLDTLFTQQVFGYKLPLVGSALSSAGDFIGSMRANLIGYLNGLVTDYKSAHAGQDPTTAGIMQDGVNHLMTSLGFNGGVAVTVIASAKEIDFALNLTKVLFNGSVNLSGDLGIPGLGISVSNGNVNLELDMSMVLNFGYSYSGGFFMLDSMAGQHALALNFAVTIPQSFQAGLTLGILTVTGTNGSHVFTNADGSTASGTSLSGGVFVDLHPKTLNDLSDMGVTTTSVASTAASGNQTISLTLPANLDVTSAYSFQLVVDGTPVTVSIAADSGRSTTADFVSAVNAALSHAQIAKSVVDSTKSGNESLSDLGLSASVSNGVLSFTVLSSKLGANASLSLRDVPLAFSGLSSNLRVYMAANLNLDLNLVAATSLGSSVSLPTISTEMLFQYQLDKVFVGTVPGAVSGVVVPFTFQNVTLDLGGFLSTFLMPVLNTAYQLIQPIMPVLDFITAPLPGISDILGHSVSLLDIAQLLGGQNPQAQKIINAINIINEVANLVKSIKDQSSGGNIMYNFGTYTFGQATVGPNANQAAQGATSAGGGNFDPFSGQSLSNYNLDSNTLATVAPTTSGSNASQKGALKQLGALQSNGGITLPILKDPMGALSLLMGKATDPVTLFEWQLPSIGYTFNKQWEFPIASIAGIISIDAIVGLNFNVSLNLTFGYDTFGIQEFLTSHNPFFILDGFFVDDSKGPQVTADVSVTAGASLDVTLAKVSLTGTIGGKMSMELYDPNHDGKVRPSEIISELSIDPNPLALFEFSGEVYAKVDLDVWVGIHLPLIGNITFFEHDWTLVDATLVSFTITPVQHPVLATTNSDGVATLNIGPLASQRLVGDTTSHQEDVLITGNGGNSVTITYNGSSQTLTANKIIADTGDGNTHITLRNVGVGITITGGDGNNVLDLGANDGVFTFGNGNNTIIGTNSGDTITVGDGNNVIIDGDGNDTIIAGNGNNYIDSGAGNDFIQVGTGNNLLIGGLGNNAIRAGSGNNIIIGGQATSVASTFTNQGNTYTLFGPNGSNTISNAGAVGDGNNTIWAGSGDNVVFGGGGSDTITLSGGGTNVVIADEGSVIFSSANGGFASVGASSIIKVSATGTIGGNDYVNGLTSFGDEIMLGGAGNDTLVGSAGTNIIIGDDGWLDGPAGGSGGHFSVVSTNEASGNDLMIGGVNADVMLGGPGNDSIEGGPGNDVIAGDDATVVRTAAWGSSAQFLTMTVTPDGSNGADSIDGSTGNDMIAGGGGNDIIDGGSGNNVMLGDFGVIDASAGTTILVTSTTDSSGHTDGNDLMHATDGGNVMIGGGGSDSMTAGNGNDIFFGDSGSVVLDATTFAVSSAQTMDENNGAGDTIVITGTGNNIAFGGAGNDTILLAGSGNNVAMGDFGKVDYSVAGKVIAQGWDGALSGNGDDLIYLVGGLATLGGSLSVGADLTLTLQNSALAGGQISLVHHVANGDSFASIASQFAALINANSALQAAGITALSSDSSVLVNGVVTVTGSDSASVTSFAITGGATGPNIATGGGGNDTISIYGTGNNRVFGDNGAVTLASADYSLITTTTTEESVGGDDTIAIYGSGANVVMGGAGNDTITIKGSGNNTVLGDLGSITVSGSTLLVSSHDATSDTNSTNYRSNDTITINGDGNNIVMAGNGADTVTVNGNGQNYVLGDSGLGNFSLGGGAPVLEVLTTVDALGATGEEQIGGNDTIVLNSSGTAVNYVMAGAGQDHIEVAGSSNNIILGDLGVITRETIDGSVGYHVLGHNTGYGDGNTNFNDTIVLDASANGSNTVMGGAGSDSISVASTGNYALAGNNLIFGDSGEITQAAIIAFDQNIRDISVSMTGVNGSAPTEQILMNGQSNSFEIRGSATAGDVLTVSGTSSWLTWTEALGYHYDKASYTYTVQQGDTLESIARNFAAKVNAVKPPVLYDPGYQDIRAPQTYQGITATGWFGTVAETADQANGAGDQITIQAGANGDNTILGGTGNDHITINGSGDNSALGDFGVVVAVSGDHPDAIARNVDQGSADTVTIGATAAGNNLVIGGGGAESIVSNGTGLNVLMGAGGEVTHQNLGGRLYPELVTSDEQTHGGGVSISATQGTNFMFGGAGDNSIAGGTGRDYVVGHAGTMMFDANVATTNTPREMRSDHFPVGGTTHIDVAGGDYNYAIGGSGSNTIAGGDGNNVLFGAQGDVVWNADGSRSFVTSLSDRDGIVGDNTIIAGAGNNDIIGGDNHNYLQAGDGGNVMIGHGGRVFYKQNIEVMAETLDQYGGGSNTLMVGSGHSFLFGGSTAQNYFGADPLKNGIFNTDGHVDIKEGRQAEWSLPPFIGNPVVSAMGNWFHASISIGDENVNLTNWYHSGVGELVRNPGAATNAVVVQTQAATQLQTPSASVSAVSSVAAAHGGGEAAALFARSLATLPGVSQMSAADHILIGSHFGSGELVSLDHAAQHDQTGLLSEASVRVAEEDGHGHEDAAIVAANQDDQPAIPAGTSLVFDSASGFWVADQTDEDEPAPVLELGAAPVLNLQPERRVAQAA